MIKKNYLDYSLILLNSAQLRLTPNITNKEKEIDRLFSYCMSRLTWDIDSFSEPKKSCILDLKQSYPHRPDTVTLCHGRLSTYTSKFVENNEFYFIIQEVADIFNDVALPNYSALCSTIPERAYLTVSFDII